MTSTFAVGHNIVLGTCLYGWPASPTWPSASASYPAFQLNLTAKTRRQFNYGTIPLNVFVSDYSHHTIHTTNTSRRHSSTFPQVANFHFVAEGPDTVHIFTDGSCTRPTISVTKLASLSSISATHHRITAAGPLRGLVQSSNRAELQAVIVSVQWTDSAYTAQGAWRLLDDESDPPNSSTIYGSATGTPVINSNLVSSAHITLQDTETRLNVTIPLTHGPHNGMRTSTGIQASSDSGATTTLPSRI